MKRPILLLLAAMLLGGVDVADASYTNPPLAAEAPSPKKALMGENRPGSNCSGEQLDPNIGFYYLRARWMAPAQGRFVSVDPFRGCSSESRSLHRYLYAGANPVLLADPSGQFWTVLFAGIGMYNSLASVKQVSGKRQPPTRKQLLSDPKVSNALDVAWAFSKIDSPDRHEEGGWIYGNDRTSELKVVFALRGEACSCEENAVCEINIAYPKIIDDFYVVGDFHTHPCPVDGDTPPPVSERISSADFSTTYENRVPSIVQDRWGRFAYGPLRRISYSGNRGYPGITDEDF